MRKDKKEMPTDSCGNFWFVNKVGGEYAFAKEPIYIDKSTIDYYKSKLPTVFTFEEGEELLYDSNLWTMPPVLMFDQLVKEFYDKYSAGQWEIRTAGDDGGWNVTGLGVGDCFRYAFGLKEGYYNPFIEDKFDDRKGRSYFHSGSKVNGAQYSRYVLGINKNRVCSRMIGGEAMPLGIRPVTLFPNREISYNKGSNFIYLKI